MRRTSTTTLVLSLLLPLASPCRAQDGAGGPPALSDRGPQIVPDTLLDCNRNTTADYVEILHDPGLDGNHNGLIDRCEFSGDMDGSGVVDTQDLINLVLHWGECSEGVPHCMGDLDGDGLVDVEDLIILILHWG